MRIELAKLLIRKNMMESSYDYSLDFGKQGVGVLCQLLNQNSKSISNMFLLCHERGLLANISQICPTWLKRFN